MNLKALVGSGDKIALATAPFLIIGVILNVVSPSWFAVGGPPPALEVASVIIVALGVVLWLWSVALILTRVPRGELITGGPFALARHPLYTSVSLLVVPWAGFLLNTWLGIVVGVAMYVAARRYATEEEKQLSTTFGAAWEAYKGKVLMPWL